jgi:hypothetical protein
MLDVDGAGVQVEPDEMAHLVDLKLASINLEFWIGPDTSLTCQFSWIPLGLEVKTFYLDGLTVAETAHFKSVLISYINSFSGTIGYVLIFRGIPLNTIGMFSLIHFGWATSTP